MAILQWKEMCGDPGRVEVLSNHSWSKVGCVLYIKSVCSGMATDNPVPLIVFL
jgi:hypothetical protein